MRNHCTEENDLGLRCGGRCGSVIGMYVENSGSRGEGRMRSINHLPRKMVHDILAWPGLAWFALYVLYSLLFVLPIAFDSFYGTNNTAGFPHAGRPPESRSTE